MRTKGAHALAECLAGARPLIDVLWQRELKTHAIDTPERRAAFEERMEKLLAEIGNARVKDHYRREVKNRLFNLWREQGTDRRKLPAGASARGKRESGPTPIPSARGFVTVIIIALVNHPSCSTVSAKRSPPRYQGQGACRPAPVCDPHHLRGQHVTREQLVDRLEAGNHGKLFAQLSRDSAFKRVAFSAGTPGPRSRSSSPI